MPRRFDDPAIAGTASIRTSLAQFLRLSSMYTARTLAYANSSSFETLGPMSGSARR